MEFDGVYEIKASRDVVWDALNDVEILRQAIPGCRSLEIAGDGGFRAEVELKIGPVKAKFQGQVRLEDVRKPESYRLTGEGQGGIAGFAKGSADVTFKELEATNTELSYHINAQIGGKIAQVGSRLMAGTVKKLADKFFNALRTLIEQG